MRLILTFVSMFMLSVIQFSTRMNAQTTKFKELDNPYLDLYLNLVEDSVGLQKQFPASSDMSETQQQWLYYSEVAYSKDKEIAPRQAEIKGKAIINDMIRSGIETAVKYSNKCGEKMSDQIVERIMSRLNYTLATPMTHLRLDGDKWEAKVTIAMAESSDEFYAMLEKAFENEGIFDATMQKFDADYCRRLSLKKVLNGMFSYLPGPLSR